MKVGAESARLRGLPRAGGVCSTSPGWQQLEGTAGLGRGVLASRKQSAFSPATASGHNQETKVKHHIVVFLGWKRVASFP